MTKTGDLRTQVVRKLNNSSDEPTFFLGNKEVEWIVKDWLQTHTKNKVEEISSDTFSGGYVLEVTISNSKIIQHT